MKAKNLLRVRSYPTYARRIINNSKRKNLSKKDKKRLEEDVPKFKNYSKLADENRRLLEPYYNDYVNSVSIADMTLSLESSIFFKVICDIEKPRKNT